MWWCLGVEKFKKIRFSQNQFKRLWSNYVQVYLLSAWTNVMVATSLKHTVSWIIGKQINKTEVNDWSLCVKSQQQKFQFKKKFQENESQTQSLKVWFESTTSSDSRSSYLMCFIDGVHGSFLRFNWQLTVMTFYEWESRCNVYEPFICNYVFSLQ